VRIVIDTNLVSRFVSFSPKLSPIWMSYVEPNLHQPRPAQAFHQRAATGVFLLNAGHARLEGPFLPLMLGQFLQFH
jgi:hypothetical protein